MDKLIINISIAIDFTYKSPSISILINLKAKQGRILPRKLQKQWKKELAIYHSTRKAIHTIIHDQNQLNHPTIIDLQKYNNIPIPRTDPLLKQEWITTLIEIGKIGKRNTRNINTKQTTINCKKAISKYRNILNLQPKQIHKNILYKQMTPH
jgi:hypothetical protein